MLPIKTLTVVTVILLLIVGALTRFSLANDSLREIKVDISESKVVIESLNKTATYEDRLKVEFDAGSTWINLEYDTVLEGNETMAKVKVELFDLIEFVDVNANGTYDSNIPQEFVKKIGLDELKPETLLYENISENDILGVRINAVLTAPSKYPNLSFRLTLHLFGDFVLYQGVPLEPTVMKLDIGINNFPFSNETSKLALHSKVTIVAEDKLEEKTEGAVAGKVGKWTVFFSWSNTSDVDGSLAPVESTIVELKSVREPGKFDFVNELYLSYEQGNQILHDPRMGVGTLHFALFTPFPWTILYGVIVIVAIGVIALILVKRKVKRD